MEYLTREIFENLMSGLPVEWDGQSSILHMKENANRHWRQMEWAGWYFQHMCETILSRNNFMEIPGPRFGKVEFDGFKHIPWDFKAHSNQSGNKVPTNGFLEVKHALNRFGRVGFIIACLDVEYDDDSLSFKAWHDELKGKTSSYEQERIKRGAPSRKRKSSCILTDIVFVLVDNRTIDSCGSFQKDMRNSNGLPRNAKVLIDLANNQLEQYIYSIR